MLVQHILKSKPVTEVVTVAPGTRVSEVVRVLSDRRIGAVIVSKDGQHVEGILSERDVVRELGSRGTACLEDVVDTMMTRSIIACTKDETAVQVLEKMTEGRFRHMPVMENGKMIGLISIGDVVKARLAELAMETEALTGMIMGT